MKKLLCLILALLLIALPLCSCSEEEDVSATESTETPTALVPHLGITDEYAGKTLRFLSAFEDFNFCKEQYAVDETNSDPVNDACFERYNLLKQNYGFTINVLYNNGYGEFVTRVNNDLSANTTEYDVCCSGIQSLAFLVEYGAFLDYYAIEDSNLKLSGKWWDIAAQEDLSIKHRLYFLTGDLFMLDDEYTRCVYYNKDIVAEEGLDNPSELVFGNTWTVDKMYEMAKAVPREDGDGVMNVTGDDRWGLVCNAFECYSLVLGCDCPQVSKDNDDIPSLSMLETKNVNAFQTVYGFMSDKTCTAWTEQYYAWNDPNARIVTDNFFSGDALFFIGLIRDVSRDEMRNAEIRYGILPMPKYDQEQEAYATPINPYQFMCASIINTCNDTDFVTFALEAMAYTGREMITPEYYDRTLKNKRFLDDDDSPEMLDLIFSNRIADISIIFNWNDCIQYYNQALVGGGELVSRIQSKRSAFETALNKTLESLDKYDS